LTNCSTRDTFTSKCCIWTAVPARPIPQRPILLYNITVFCLSFLLADCTESQILSLRKNAKYSMIISTRKILSSIQLFINRQELTFCLFCVLYTADYMFSNLWFYSRQTVHMHNFKWTQKRVQILHTDNFILLKLKLKNKVHQIHSNRQCNLTGHTFASRHETHVANQSECDIIARYKFLQINTALIIDTSNPWWKRPGRQRSEDYLVTVCWS